MKKQAVKVISMLTLVITLSLAAAVPSTQAQSLCGGVSTILEALFVDFDDIRLLPPRIVDDNGDIWQQKDENSARVQDKEVGPVPLTPRDAR